MTINADAEQFAQRLVKLLAAAGQKRRGAGAYLARKYKVSTVTANDWLNGVHKPGIPVAEKIAKDHGSTLDQLYFNRTPVRQVEKSSTKQRQSEYGTDSDKVADWPFRFDRNRFERLDSNERYRVEGAMMLVIREIELEHGQAQDTDAGGRRELQRR